MRSFTHRFFRFVLSVQAAVVEGCEILAEANAVEILVRRRSNAKPRCPECRRVLGGEIREHRRRWRHLNIVRTRSYLSCTVREGFCPRHGRRVEMVPWAFPGARFTKAFDYQVASLVQVADKSAAARMFQVTWRTVGRMVTRVVESELPKDRLEDLTYIGIDETSYKRGHRYLTVVCNLATGRVVWLGEGKSAETLGTFFDELGVDRCREVEVVCMDMSAAYTKAVHDRAPNAAIVYDKFHVVKLLLDAIDEVRREEVRGLEGEAKKALKGTRFALLRNPKHRTPKDEESIRQVKKTNRRLARAYELRVDFEELWKIEDPDEAEDFVKSWTRDALKSRLDPLRRFATTVRGHAEGILAHFHYWRATSAQMEGTNNKIKLAIHKAFGFRSIEALMAMVYLCCGGLTLVGRPGT